MFANHQNLNVINKNFFFDRLIFCFAEVGKKTKGVKSYEIARDCWNNEWATLWLGVIFTDGTSIGWISRQRLDPLESEGDGIHDLITDAHRRYPQGQFDVNRNTIYNQFGKMRREYHGGNIRQQRSVEMQ